MSQDSQDPQNSQKSIGTKYYDDNKFEESKLQRKNQLND